MSIKDRYRRIEIKKLIKLRGDNNEKETDFFITYG